MLEALQFEFMQHAMIAGILASIICGIIGTLVVVNRIVFIAGGIAHGAYGGIGLAFYLGIPYLVGTIGFSLICAMIMAFVSLKARHRTDTIIGVIWAVGMATGIILMDLSPGYNVDLMSYLFGSILTVPKADIGLMAVVCIGITLTTLCYYNGFLAMSYDEEFAQIRGVPVRLLYFVLLAMIALSVVMIIRVVGLILIIALMTIPPYIAEKYSKSLIHMMILSTLMSALFIIIGLWLSYHHNLSSGATIILTGGVAFFISGLVDHIRKKIIAQ